MAFKNSPLACTISLEHTEQLRQRHAVFVPNFGVFCTLGQDPTLVSSHTEIHVLECCLGEALIKTPNFGDELFADTYGDVAGRSVKKSLPVDLDSAVECSVVVVKFINCCVPIGVCDARKNGSDHCTFRTRLRLHQLFVVSLHHRLHPVNICLAIRIYEVHDLVNKWVHWIRDENARELCSYASETTTKA